MKANHHELDMRGIEITGDVYTQATSVEGRATG